MIGAGKLDILRPGDVGREVTTALDIDSCVAGAMQDESRDADCRKNVAHVDLTVHPHEGDDGGWAGAHPLEAGPPLLEPLIRDLCGRKGTDAFPLPPGL